MKIKVCIKWRKSGYAILIAPIFVLHKWMSSLQITIWTRVCDNLLRGVIDDERRRQKKERLTVTLHFRGQVAFSTYSKQVFFSLYFALYGTVGYTPYPYTSLLLVKQSLAQCVLQKYTYFICVYRTHAISSVTVQMLIHTFMTLN